ncbi:hypothetical protein BJ085DRAFT_16213, partial [Dimargaris cristalligena]
LVKLDSTQFLLPGFIDTHVHAAQFANIGIGYSLPLLDWLDTFTFPEEAKFADLNYARRVYEAAVSTFIRHGTTTAVYYATIHTDSTSALVDIVRRRGQRAWVGKVNMDRNAPEYYIETTEDSLAETERFIQTTLKSTPAENQISTVLSSSLSSSPVSDSSSPILPLVTPVITPRFVGSCSVPLMKGLAQLARQYQLPIQSHLSENQAEIAWIEGLHPECQSYTDIYRTYGLLGDQPSASTSATETTATNAQGGIPRSIMAHCVHPKPDELTILRDYQVGVAHCPNSNFALGSGMAHVRNLWNYSLAVGLGTDVSGGSSPSMVDAMRQAATASRIRQMAQSAASRTTTAGESDSSPTAAADRLLTPLTIGEVLYMATLGGAEVLGWSERLGSFAPGKTFDALVAGGSFNELNPVALNEGRASGPQSHKWWLNHLERFVYLGDDRNIKQVFVQGKCIHQLD